MDRAQQRKARLDNLYVRHLTPPSVGGKTFPLEFTLNKSVLTYPDSVQIPVTCDRLEIGPGSGEFLIGNAVLDPNLRWLGVEIDRKRFEHIKDICKAKQLTNVTLAHSDARTVLHKWLPENSVETIYVLFPDPWPKNRHRHKRLLTPEMLTLIVSRLKPQGKLVLGTDVRDYATWTLENSKSVPALALVNELEPIKHAAPELATTTFQKKWTRMGRTLNFIEWRKV